ncbi:MAG: hypothetical protein H7335_09020 [Massilia sp.]|nr:hypothetical protein [Massilia sp.]
MNFTRNPAKNETNMGERGLPLLAAKAMFNPAMQVRGNPPKLRKLHPVNMVFAP